MLVRLEEIGYEWGIGGPQEHSDELIVLTAMLIDFLVNDEAFAVGTKTSSWLLLAFRPPLVVFGADDEHEICMLDLLAHPTRPTVRRSGLVLIYHRVNSIASQAVRQAEDLFV